MILQIDLDSHDKISYEIEGSETRSIKDIDIYEQYLNILYDKNEIQVIDLSTKQKIFKSVFNDSSEILTRLFYMPIQKDSLDPDDDPPTTISTQSETF